MSAQPHQLDDPRTHVTPRLQREVDTGLVHERMLVSNNWERQWIDGEVRGDPSRDLSGRRWRERLRPLVEALQRVGEGVGIDSVVAHGRNDKARPPKANTALHLSKASFVW
jgi:hypothetical protein